MESDLLQGQSIDDFLEKRVCAVLKEDFASPDERQLQGIFRRFMTPGCPPFEIHADSGEHQLIDLSQLETLVLI